MTPAPSDTLKIKPQDTFKLACRLSQRVKQMHNFNQDTQIRCSLCVCVGQKWLYPVDPSLQMKPFRRLKTEFPRRSAPAPINTHHVSHISLRCPALAAGQTAAWLQINLLGRRHPRLVAVCRNSPRRGGSTRVPKTSAVPREPRKSDFVGK